MTGLYGIKPAFVRSLRGVEDVLVRRRVSPDTITIAAVHVSILTGGMLLIGGLTGDPFWFALVAPLAVVRLALNALDGSVARRTDRSRLFGQALNEVCDRVSDAFVIVPFVILASPALALGALFASLAASFVGVLSLGVTGVRDYGGPMGKADRMAVVGLSALAGIWNHQAFTWGMLAVLVGAVVTAAGRLRRVHARCAAGRTAGAA